MGQMADYLKQLETAAKPDTGPSPNSEVEFESILSVAN